MQGVLSTESCEGLKALEPSIAGRNFAATLGLPQRCTHRGVLWQEILRKQLTNEHHNTLQSIEIVAIAMRCREFATLRTPRQQKEASEGGERDPPEVREAPAEGVVEAVPAAVEVAPDRRDPAASALARMGPLRMGGRADVEKGSGGLVTESLQGGYIIRD